MPTLRNPAWYRRRGIVLLGAGVVVLYLLERRGSTGSGAQTVGNTSLPASLATAWGQTGPSTVEQATVSVSGNTISYCAWLNKYYGLPIASCPTEDTLFQVPDQPPGTAGTS